MQHQILLLSTIACWRPSHYLFIKNVIQKKVYCAHQPHALHPNYIHTSIIRMFQGGRNREVAEIEGFHCSYHPS